MTDSAGPVAKPAARRGESRSTPSPAVERAPTGGLLDLQRGAGNQAVGGLLTRAAGDPGRPLEFCGTYGSRPGVCRGYSCAHDTRIWNDFDRMELNTEWIEAWLHKREEPQAMAMVLYRARPDRQEAS